MPWEGGETLRSFADAQDDNYRAAAKLLTDSLILKRESSNYDDSLSGIVLEIKGLSAAGRRGKDSRSGPGMTRERRA